jgi:outer membrane biosynthesis protein TonB
MKASDSKHLLLLFLLPIQTLVSSSRVPLLLVVVVWLIRLPPAAAAMTPTRSNNAKTVKKEEEEETTPAQEPKPITHNKTNKQSNQRRRCFTTYLPTYLPSSGITTFQKERR